MTPPLNTDELVVASSDFEDAFGEADGGKQSRIISKVLAPAIRFWLRSQLDQVEDLQLTIEAGDRQLLSGTVRQVSLVAEKAIYQGLHVSQVKVTAAGIRTNLGQVLRGKAFRLLEAFPVAGNLVMQETDLNASLQAPLLSQAVIDFLLPFLNSSEAKMQAIENDQSIRLLDSTIKIEPKSITLTANLVHSTGTIPIHFRTDLAIEQGNRLHLRCPQWLQADGVQSLEDQVFYLGEHVNLDTLNLESGQIHCRGQVTVIPA